MKYWIALCLFLVGCASTESKYAVLPVAVKSGSVAIPAKPYLPIYALQENSSPELVMKSYVASVYALDGYCDSLVTIHEGYK